MKRTIRLASSRARHLNHKHYQGVSKRRRAFGNSRSILFTLLCLVFICPISMAYGATLGPYSSLTDFQNAINSVNSIYGTPVSEVVHVVLADSGTAYSGDLNVSNVVGSENHKVIIRSETPGGATISGNINWNFTSCDYLVIHGFNFYNITGSTFMVLKDFSHGRVTNNTFDNTPDHTIDIRGTNNDFSLVGWSQNNTIDHNTFKNHTDTILIEVFIIHRDPECGYGYTWHDDGNTDNTFEYNVFKDCSLDNNREAIQIGRGSGNTCYNEEAYTATYTTVQFNLFDNWDDDEIISVKSANNTIRFNTIISSNGAIKNRLGHNNTYNANIFDIGSETSNTKFKGLRIQGTGHVIKNNYFRGTDHGIQLAQGDGANDPDVDDVLIANNTFKDSEYGVYRYGSEPNNPTNVTVINNHAERTSGSFTWRELFADLPGTGNTWGNNLVYCPSCPNDGVDTNISSGVTKLGSARLVNQKAGLLVNWYYPNAYTDGIFNLNVTFDIEGQTRANPPDIGFDENTDADIGRPMLTEENVGVQWPGITLLSAPTGLRIISGGN